MQNTANYNKSIPYFYGINGDKTLIKHNYYGFGGLAGKVPNAYPAYIKLLPRQAIWVYVVR